MIPMIFGKLSAWLSAFERFLLKFLIAALTLSVLMNVLLRMVGITIAWADEIGVYTMILSGFVGASLMLRARIDPAVLLLHEFMSSKGRWILHALVSALATVFGIILCYLCVRWFDPVEIAKAGFDATAFQAATFNFIYTDQTPVMAVPAFLFYLVIPFFAVAITIHALTNLFEDFGWLERPEDPAGLAMDVVQ